MAHKVKSELSLAATSTKVCWTAASTSPGKSRLIDFDRNSLASVAKLPYETVFAAFLQEHRVLLVTVAHSRVAVWREENLRRGAVAELNADGAR